MSVAKTSHKYALGSDRKTSQGVCYGLYSAVAAGTEILKSAVDGFQSDISPFGSAEFIGCGRSLYRDICDLKLCLRQDIYFSGYAFKVAAQ
jgi:hypothetical protein